MKDSIKLDRREAEDLQQYLEAIAQTEESTDGGMVFDMAEAREHANMLKDKLMGRIE